MRLLGGLVIQVPTDLEVVGDEADGTDEHLAHTPLVQVVEVIQDVRPQPGLARRRLALEREGPAREGGALRDQS